MDNDFLLSEKVFQERMPLIQRILLLYLCVMTPIALTEIVGLFLEKASLAFICMTLIDIGSIGLAVWTKQAKTQATLEPRLKTLMILYLTSNALAVFTNHNAIFNLAGTIVLVFTFLSIAGLFRFARQLGRIGLTLLVVLGLAEITVLLHPIVSSELAFRNLAVDTMSIILAVINTFGALILLYWFNNALNKSMQEANQRQTEAEAAQAATTASLAQIRHQAAEQERLLELIQDLETPAVPLLPGVLALPVVGHLDTRRISRLNDSLLERISEDRAHTVLLDLTGVGLIDTATANYLLQLVRSVRLLGARCIMTGIRADVAQTMVTLGIEWEDIPTTASLQNAIQALLIEQAQQKPQYGI